MRVQITALLLLSACTSDYALEKDPEPVEQGSPIMEVTPRTLVFDAMLPGEVDSAPVTVANLGDAPLRVLGFTLGEPAGAFAVFGPGTPFDLDPGALATLDVIYTAGPTDAADVLSIGSNDPFSPNADVSLAGGSEQPLLELDPPVYDFGPQVPGCEVVGVVTARSVGTAPVTVDLAEAGGAFILDPAGLPVTLEPGAELPLVITYEPEAGEASATLTVLSDSVTGTATAELVGVGVPPAPVLDLFETFPIATEPVYIHDPYDVYAWDPATNTTTFIASSPVYLVDIAIDYDGYLLGLGSNGDILRIDPATALSTTWLSSGTIGANALTVLPDNRIVSAGGGTVWEVDRKTGAATTLTTYAGTSSGDITEVAGALYWTVSGDDLVVIDPSTWVATRVGPTGQVGLWGLAWPDGELWAFSSAGNAHELDPATGAVLDTVATGVCAYGAAHNPRYGMPEEYWFELSQEPIEETLVVLVDGTAAGGWLYLPADNTVWFPEGALAGGETVEVSYEIPPECG